MIITPILTKRTQAIVKSYLAPLMKANGFVKQGDAFSKNGQGLIYFVDIQRSRWNDPTTVSFTLNCGIYVAGIQSGFRGMPEPKKPKPADCVISARAGMLAAKQQDVWWKVTTDGEADSDTAIGSELAMLTQQTILPFLARFRSAEDVATFLQADRSDDDQFVEPRARALGFAYAAILWKASGNREQCRNCIEGALPAASKTPLRELISDFCAHFSC